MELSTHYFNKIVRYSINMSRQTIDSVDDEKSDKVEVQGSEVRGSGRAIFTLVHMVFNLIDDELTVLDAQKCAGKKVDMGKCLWRLASGAVNKASVQGAQGNLGDSCIKDAFGGTVFCY
jgi:hypothetical protein